jgi:hypothetical protein
VGMEAIYRKAHSALRESTMLRHCYYSLGERVFRRSWFFGGTLIAWKIFFWCADGAVSPPRANFIPTKCGKITALYHSKAYWRLNKTGEYLQTCLCTPREAQGFHTHFMTTKNRERRNSFRRANCVPSGTRLRRVSGLW